MHDIMFANKIMSLLKETIGGKKYKCATVNVSLGPFTHLTPESLRSAFAMLNEKEGFKDALLNIKKGNAVIKCNGCKATTEISGPVSSCPQCKCADFELESAEEFTIQSIEIE